MCRCAFESVVSWRGVSPKELRHSYNYALMVPGSLVGNLTELHFTMVPAAVLRCPPKHFGRIASLGGLSPYCKVSLVVSCYLGATTDKGAVQTQVVGVATCCAGVAKAALQQMKSEPEVLQRGDLSHMSMYV